MKDLGVIIASDLKFSSHVSQTAAKAHARASLILKCFISKDPITLVKAFITYVRPILEYASSMWSPYTRTEVDKLESAQRAFTKRIPGQQFKSYGDRLAALGLESLELRRLRLDLLLTYKILFNLVDIDGASLFVLRAETITRGHNFKLYMQRSRLNLRHKFFCNRIVPVWNDLPADNSCFNSLSCFKSFLYSTNLSKYVTANSIACTC